MADFCLKVAMIAAIAVSLAIPCLFFATTVAMWAILIGTGTLVVSGITGVVLDWREITYK